MSYLFGCRNVWGCKEPAWLVEALGVQFALLGVGSTISLLLVSSPLKPTLLPDKLCFYFLLAIPREKFKVAAHWYELLRWK